MLRKPSPLVPFPIVELDLQRVQHLACPNERFPLNGVTATESLSYFVCVQCRLLLILHIKPSDFSRRSARSTGDYLIYIETTSFPGAGHAVEKMDADSEAPSSPVKIHLDEIDKLGNYESIFP